MTPGLTLIEVETKGLPSGSFFVGFTLICTKRFLLLLFLYMPNHEVLIPSSKPSEPTIPQSGERQRRIKRTYELASSLLAAHVEKIGEIFKSPKPPRKKIIPQ